MEKRNTIVLTVIMIAILLIAVFGATFAYFSAVIRDDRGDGNNGSTNIKAGEVASRTIVGMAGKSAGSFTAEDVYPGHKEVAAFKVTVKSGGEAHLAMSSINIMWKGTNNFADDAIKITLYEANEDKNTTKDYFECKKDLKQVGQEMTYYETCNNNEENLGTIVGTQILKKSDKNVKLNTETIHIQSTSVDVEKYFYVVAEYVNKDQDSQNVDFGKNLSGKVEVELAA